MPYERLTIKDIAERAGVSTGTVDRVIHNHPNVSKKSLEKVNKVLKEINFEPNMYASALANTRRYDFFCLIPKHESEAYWQEVEEGQKKCCDTRRDFHVHINIKYYKRLDDKSFTEQYKAILKENPDGVIIVPTRFETTKVFTDILHKEEIPFILLDSYLPDLKPLAFYGQDSFASGYFAAKMLMLLAAQEKEVLLVKQTVDGERLPSKQQENREVGFMHYMKERFPNIKINTLDLSLAQNKKQHTALMEQYFSAHPETHHCITMSSKAHIVGEFLSKTKRTDKVQIMGYDMVAKNAECIRKGSISFLIAQHGYQQGYSSVDALVRYTILKKNITPVNYMPIEILSKENVDFYRRTQI